MELSLSEPKMNSFLPTALPEAMLRGDRRLLPREIYQHLQPSERDFDVHRSLSALCVGTKGSVLYYAIPQNTREATEFSAVDFCRKGNGSHIHDSLLYGYDADQNNFGAIAQVGYHKKEVFYTVDELEEAYCSTYSGSSEKAQ